MFLTMSEPTVASVRRFIKAVAYTGRYVYGRKHWRRVLAGGDPVPSHRPVGQFIELTEHHEGYISYDEYVENQKDSCDESQDPEAFAARTRGGTAARD